MKGKQITESKSSALIEVKDPGSTLSAPGTLFFVEIFGIIHFENWDVQICQILEYSIFHGISQNIPNLIWDIHRLGKSGI